MEHHDVKAADFGTAEKKLSIYLFGTISCVILTILSFWVVMKGQFSKEITFAIIYASACVQFVVQVVCFLRLNTQTEQAKTNVMAIVFTFVILVTIIIGTLWIMANVNANMMPSMSS